MKLIPPYKIDRHDMLETITPDEDGVRIGHIQDCQGVLERNKRIREAQANKDFAADIVTVASIPAVIFEKLLSDNNMKWPPNEDQLNFIMKLIENDPALKHFRTA